MCKEWVFIDFSSKQNSNWNTRFDREDGTIHIIKTKLNDNSNYDKDNLHTFIQFLNDKTQTTV